MIQGAINKSESFNKFAQWVSFGGQGLLAENNRDEQHKLIKYNHLVANSLIFYNVYAMTEALHRLSREAVALSKETLQRLSPYLTAHVNRFGDYQLDPNRKPPDLNYDLEISHPGRQHEVKQVCGRTFQSCEILIWPVSSESASCTIQMLSDVHELSKTFHRFSVIICRFDSDSYRREVISRFSARQLRWLVQEIDWVMSYLIRWRALAVRRLPPEESRIKRVK